MRKALLVGIDDYLGSPLTGCVADARRMAELLALHADKAPNFACRTLVSGDTHRITRTVLRDALRNLWFDESEVALFYFAGHGTRTDLGGYLTTVEATRPDEGLPMTDVFTLANRSQCREAVIILDCCHSGAIGRASETDPGRAVLREGVSVLSAAHEGESAGVEAGGRGLFTSLVCEALEGSAADVRGRVTAASVYAYADQILGAWQQRPLFRAHLSRLTSLRNCPPAVPLETLEKLLAHFTTPDQEWPLDPSYDDGLEPHDAEHERIFADFRKYLRAGLLEPVGEEYLYQAALNRKSCRLTALGRFYWQLAKAGRL